MNFPEIEKLLANPLTFDKSKIDEWVAPKKVIIRKEKVDANGSIIPGEFETIEFTPPQISHSEIVTIIRRIFDLNENANLGEAHTGRLKKLNNKSRKKRNKGFHKDLRKNPKLKKIYAEGDSWMEHPFLKDIVDHLKVLGKGKYAIYSSAAAGDWLTNIVHEGKYLTEISVIQPDIIILSGGGNDIIGGKKLSMMIDGVTGPLKPKLQQLKNSSGEEIKDFLNQDEYFSKIMTTDRLKDENECRKFVDGAMCLSNDFLSLVWAFELQYKYVISNILKKHQTTKILIQGYDYCIPTKKRGGLFRLKKWFFNTIQNNGRWMYDALLYRGISDPKTQENIMFAFIYLFNEMLARVANSNISIGKTIGPNGEEINSTGNVYHIDCRGTARKKDWFDEMHLNSKTFGKVAQTFFKCIEHKTDRKEKTFRVTE